MAGTDQGEPGDERGVLHRVPGPEAAEAEGFVGPGTAHEDARTQHHHPEEGPRQGRGHPVAQAALPQPGDRVGEGHQRGREAQEQRGRMDGHPVVLQQRVKTAAISELRDALQVVGQGGPRQADVLRKLADQQEGTAADADLAEVNAQQHGGQEGLYQREDGHHRCLPVPCLPDQDVAQYHVPEGPEEKGPFLPLPETGEDVAQRHGPVAVLPHVVVLEPMVQQHDEEHRDDAQHGHRMQPEPASSKPFPYTVVASYGRAVGHQCQQGAHEAQDGQHMPEMSCPGVLTHVRDGLVVQR